jgi:DNA-binding CsgD family transcriptional regulator
VRQALGDAFDTHWHQGQTLTLKQTITAASGSRRRPTRPPTGWEALTPTERNVADLAAQNLTNAQIAERLTVSRRTVETHLHNLYAKLDVRSRSQLATRKPT